MNALGIGVGHQCIVGEGEESLDWIGITRSHGLKHGHFAKVIHGQGRNSPGNSFCEINSIVPLGEQICAGVISIFWYP